MNSTPESASNLHQSRAYLTTHIGRMTERCTLVLHHLVNIAQFLVIICNAKTAQAYLHARYLNKKVVMDDQDKAMRSKIGKGCWVILQKRVTRDTATEDDLKIRIKAALSNGFQQLKKETNIPE